MPVLRVKFYQIDIGENGDGLSATWRFRTYVNGVERQCNPANRGQLELRPQSRLPERGSREYRSAED